MDWTTLLQWTVVGVLLVGALAAIDAELDAWWRRQRERALDDLHFGALRERVQAKK